MLSDVKGIRTFHLLLMLHVIAIRPGVGVALLECQLNGMMHMPFDAYRDLEQHILEY